MQLSKQASPWANLKFIREDIPLILGRVSRTRLKWVMSLLAPVKEAFVLTLRAVTNRFELFRGTTLRGIKKQRAMVSITEVVVTVRATLWRAR